MTTNADITIIHKVFDETARTDKYITRHIYGASWYADFKATVSDKGMKSGDVYKVRVPLQNAKSLEINKGDYVVKGIIEIKETDTPKLFLKDKIAFVVTSFSVNDRGCLQHYRIFGE